MLNSWVPRPTPAFLHPRGLHNSDRKCFLNTVRPPPFASYYLGNLLTFVIFQSIQTLFSIPHLYGLLTKLENARFTPADFPTLSLLLRLFRDFEPLSLETRNAIKSGTTVHIPVGFKLEPLYFYEILKIFNPVADIQEDMQEFLCFLIDRVHSELLNATITDTNDEHRLGAADEWSTVGRNNKSAVVVTDVSNFKQSAMSKIFGGEIQSIVKRRGVKSSMALEPFFCLHLDIAHDEISTLEDALSYALSTEVIEDSSGLSKSDSIKTLPPVLLIHLKRFAFVNGKSVKITKPIYIPESLSMKGKWLGSSFTTGREYQLQSLTQHLGPRVQGGHYTSFVRQCNGDWLLFDDAHIEKVDLNEVLDNANGYVLCYVRRDA